MTHDLERVQVEVDTQPEDDSLDSTDPDQTRCDAQSPSVGVGATNFDGDQSACDTQRLAVAVEDTAIAPAGVGQGPADAQSRCADSAGALLLVLADALDDLENVRKATENRLRSLTTAKGIDTFDEAAVQLAIQLDSIKALEDVRIKALKKAMKAHPLGSWVQRTHGVGLKQCARLLAAIGDPLYNGTAGRPRRGPAELWQFCGHGDPERSKLRKGYPVEHSPTAKMRTHLVAVSCMKKRESPYRRIYEQGRAKYANAVHDKPCPQCGPKGNPAPPGSPLSAGHQQARALRLVGKEILKDLYSEARALDQNSGDAHSEPVEGT